MILYAGFHTLKTLVLEIKHLLCTQLNLVPVLLRYECAGNI